MFSLLKSFQCHRVEVKTAQERPVNYCPTVADLALDRGAIYDIYFPNVPN